MELTPARLDQLDDRVAVPRYDRDALVRSIVHIGVGGFHRAHLATYVDELAAAGNQDWSIVGGGVLEQDRAIAEALLAQDCLYTLVTRSEEGARAEVIGSIVDFVHAHPDLAPLVDRIADPHTRIVSLTVTEGGYPVDDATGGFDPTSSDGGPNSAFAAIVHGLRRRHDEGHGPVTVLSCDNVIGNGGVARTATLGVAGLFEPEIVDWIRDKVAFPNSMVDRITPQTTDGDRAWLAEQYGVEDRWPVMTEPFRQWVVEDEFAAGRPPFEELDIIITDDVEPYELFKLRLLNAGHSCLAYLARLLEIEKVDEVMAEPRFAEYLESLLDEEAGPMVPEAPGIDLEDYKRSLVERFSNPAIGDQIERLCLDGSPKFPKFLLPTVRKQLAAGGPIRLATLALAGWCEYLRGRADSGAPIDPAPDPRLDEAQGYARASEDDPAAFLGFQAVFGEDLPADERFLSTFREAVNGIRADGVRQTMDTWIPLR
jgi:mannitol 2-dehydrogenase